MYKKHLNSGSKEDEVKYKLYKNKLTNLLRCAERNYFKFKLNEVKGDIKNTWKILKTIINKKGKNTSNNTTFKCGNAVISGWWV